jgi:hypothetical protein
MNRNPAIGGSAPAWRNMWTASLSPRLARRVGTLGHHAVQLMTKIIPPIDAIHQTMLKIAAIRPFRVRRLRSPSVSR